MQIFSFLSGVYLFVGVGIVGPMVVDEVWSAENQSVWQEEVLIGAGHGSVAGGVAVDTQGQLHALWQGPDGLSTSIFYATSQDKGQHWSNPEVVYKGGRGSGAAIAIGPDNILHVALTQRESAGGAIVYIRSQDQGASWTSPVKITPIFNKKLSSPALAVDPSGRVHVSWHVGNADSEEDTAQVYYTRSVDQGATFESSKRLDTGTGNAGWPRFMTLHEEIVAISWRDSRQSPDWHIYLAVSDNGGETFTERVGSATPQREWDPYVLVDTQGTIHLAYMVYKKSDIRIDYRRSTDLGQTWSEPTTVSTDRSRFPSFVAHPQSETIWLFWKDESDFVAPDASSHQMDQLLGYGADVVGTYSSNGGLNWKSPERVTDIGNVEVKFPSLALSGDGDVYVVWNDDRSGSEMMYITAR